MTAPDSDPEHGAGLGLIQETMLWFAVSAVGIVLALSAIFGLNLVPNAGKLSLMVNLIAIFGIVQWANKGSVPPRIR